MDLFDGEVQFDNIYIDKAPYYNKKYPIYSFLNNILWAINSHNVVIIMGETGSGKSTQLPQILYNAGWCQRGKNIIISLPKRISVINLANIVAKQMNTEIGHKIGYSIRYESKTTAGLTSIKFVTDGILIKEIMTDPLLLDYNVIILDDVHERTINTDILLALLKRILKKRKSLRIILTSATMEAELFKNFFVRNDYEYLTTHKIIDAIPSRWDKSSKDSSSMGSSIPPSDPLDYPNSKHNYLELIEGERTIGHKYVENSKKYSSTSLRCINNRFHHELAQPDQLTNGKYGALKDVCIVSIKGNSFPIDIQYLIDPHQDYLEAIINTVMEIHMKELSGDILIFLTGKEEIEAVVQSIKELSYDLKPGKHNLALKPIPLYAALPQEALLNVLKPCSPNIRRVICSTNVAETSITIENIGYVIDSGFTKCKVYNPSTDINYFNVCIASKESARQRAGRIGRTRTGKLYRMMEESIFHSNIVPKYSVPEILTSDLSMLILQLKSLGIDHIADIEFINPPPLDAIEAALEKLFALEGLNENGYLTDPLGILMAEILLEPMITRMIFLSSQEPFKCVDLALKVAAMLSIREIWSTSKNKYRLDASKYFFGVSEGDLLTYYHIFEHATTYGKNDPEWAKKFNFNWPSLNNALSLYNRLKNQVNQFNIKPTTSQCEPMMICKLFCASFFLNTIRKQTDGTYTKCRQNELSDPISLSIHPNSVIQALAPNWLVYTEATGMADKIYAYHLSYIQPQWLIELCPHYFQLN